MTAGRQTRGASSAALDGAGRDHFPSPADRLPVQRSSGRIGHVAFGRYQHMSIPKLLIIVGLVLVVAGLAWPLIARIGLGRLPGDIVIERDNFHLYIPIATSLLISVVLGIIVWLLNR